MSVLPISGAADDTPEGSQPEDVRAWTVGCTDATGRPYELVITAYRHPRAGIGFTAPPGEFALVDVDDWPALARAMTDARRFLARRGRARCTRK